MSDVLPTSTAAKPASARHDAITTPLIQRVGNLWQTRPGFECMAILLAGEAFGLVVGAWLPSTLRNILGGVDVMPTTAHRMIGLLVAAALGPAIAVGTAIAGGFESSRGPLRTRRKATAFLVGCLLLCTLLLGVPGSAGQQNLVMVVSMLLYRWPPSGYCKAAAAAEKSRRAIQARGDGRLWWHTYGDNPRDAARHLVGNMSRSERATLLNGEGYGWPPFGPLDGAYMGGTPAIPRLLLPSMHLQDAAQGFRTHKREIVGQVTSWTNPTTSLHH